MSWSLIVCFGLLVGADPALDEKPANQVAPEADYRAEFVFPFDPQHNHAPGIAELPSGDLAVSWYRGSGERSADDVRVFGAIQKQGQATWSQAQVWADTPDLPDCNTCLMTGRDGRLWLFWPVILANSWESCLTQYKVAARFDGDLPVWEKQGTMFLKPADFSTDAERVLDDMLASAKLTGITLTEKQQAVIAELRKRLKEKLLQRLGWQPRCKPTVLPTGRILLPLYSDTYSISLMAISDDEGLSWRASGPLIGFGNIQPSVLRRQNGTLVAYMRENGLTHHVRVCESTDDGETWGPVGITTLPNPGSGLDGIVHSSGRWYLVHNDTLDGRHSLAMSVSEDEGQTWKLARHLEQHTTGSYHYPALIETRDQQLHCVYSYFKDGEGKTMKHAAFSEKWLQAGDQ